jgi:multidrug resistance efflux pump
MRLRVAVVVVLLVAGYYGFLALGGRTDGTLQASGTIEAVTVNVSPELAGKVTEVMVEEGQAATRGDPLAALDDSLLSGERKVAVATLDAARAGAETAATVLETAKVQYQIALEASLLQDKAARLADWFSNDPDLFDQPGWYFSRSEQIDAAQVQVDAALAALEQGRERLAAVNQSLDKANFLDAESRLLQARLAYLIARDVNSKAHNSSSANAPVGIYNRTPCGTNQGYRLSDGRLTNVIYTCRGDPQLSDAGQALYDAAQAELDAAQQAYDELLGTEASEAILAARAEVALAQERYYSALDSLHELQTADQSPAVRAAQGALEQAQAGARQAAAAVAHAEASLGLLDMQIAKLILRAPLDGVVLTRNAEPGEFVQPGAVALTMADITDLTITVYVPEDRYGAIFLGQSAEVIVDSFPGETFAAEVVHIADQAEFTPRNVQTVQGRSSTVYAIRLKVSDGATKLNIGMPADVRFLAPE